MARPFVRRGIKVAGLFQRHKEEGTGTEVGSQNEENPILDLMNGMMNALRTIPTELCPALGRSLKWLAIGAGWGFDFNHTNRRFVYRI